MKESVERYERIVQNGTKKENVFENFKKECFEIRKSSLKCVENFFGTSIENVLGEMCVKRVRN